MSRTAFVFGLSAVVLSAFALLSIGLTRDWELLHEDNGAVHTTFALSHLRLGLARTRAHDLFFEPRTGRSTPYGHHPPGPALALAGAFALTGSDSTAVARMVPILFHLGSIVLLATILRRLFSAGAALFGAVVMATVPMSSYFGRVVNYEAPCLFAVLVQLAGYTASRRTGSRAGLRWLAFGVVLGGLIDWASLFFTAAIAAGEAVDRVRRRSRPAGALAVAFVTGASILLFDLGHLWWAGHGSITPLREVLLQDVSGGRRSVGLLRFASTQFETFRRYFTHAGLLSSAVAAVAIARPRGGLAAALFKGPEREPAYRLLAVSGGAALAYVLTAPWWASAHAYWQFYFLPFAVISIVLVFRALARRAREGRNIGLVALLAVLLVEIGLTSATVLRIRHTRVSAFAVRKTAEYRANFLTPESWAGKSVSAAPE